MWVDLNRLQSSTVHVLEATHVPVTAAARPASHLVTLCSLLSLLFACWSCVALSTDSTVAHLLV